MVRDPGDYRWSSYHAHAFGAPVRFWTPNELYRALGETPAARGAAWQELVGEAMDRDTIARIRHCTNTGLVLGTEKFRNQVAVLKNQPGELKSLGAPLLARRWRLTLAPDSDPINSKVAVMSRMTIDFSSLKQPTM